MATAYPSNQALINAVNHANLKNGEVIIKLNGEVIVGRLQSISMEMREANYTTFCIEGVIS